MAGYQFTPKGYHDLPTPVLVDEQRNEWAVGECDGSVSMSDKPSIGYEQWFAENITSDVIAPILVPVSAIVSAIDASTAVL